MEDTELWTSPGTYTRNEGPSYIIPFPGEALIATAE